MQKWILSCGIEGKSGFFNYSIKDETGRQILAQRCPVLGTTYDKIEGEARLIAAAPETHDALDRLVTLIRNQDVTIARPGVDLETFLAPAVAALKKGKRL